MDKYEKTIIRRTETIDEVFNAYLNYGSPRKLTLTLDYHLWENKVLVDFSNHIMTYELKMPLFQVVFLKTDEMKTIHSKLCDFIRNRYRDKMRDTYKIYRVKTFGRGF